MKKITLGLILASALAAPSAFAAGNKMEASVNGFLQSSTSSPGGSSSITIIQLKGGYYVLPKMVVSALVNVIGTKSPGYDSQWIQLGGGAKYYFGNAAKNAVVPFVLGDLVLTSISGGSSGSGYGFDAGGGVSYFISETLSADTTAVLAYNNLNYSGFTSTSTGVQINFGLTARF